ncbi:MAG: helix-turn-helix transcriptional regulator [Rhodovibrionaceae bacterium]|nr:helix-turn-helix transcriptional regulator [Rhodovibrionaceae bacterium]
MAHPTDVHIGQRVREKRMALGYSQTALAEKLGISFQQVQKYESGANRISGSRLWEMSRVLGEPVSYFFEGLEEGNVVREPQDGRSDTELGRSTLELARAINSIDNDEVKQQFARLVKAFARAS